MVPPQVVLEAAALGAAAGEQVRPASGNVRHSTAPGTALAVCSLRMGNAPCTLTHQLGR